METHEFKLSEMDENRLKPFCGDRGDGLCKQGQPASVTRRVCGKGPKSVMSA